MQGMSQLKGVAKNKDLVMLEPLFSYMLRFVSKSVQKARSIRADMGKGRGLGAAADDDDIDDLLVMVKGKGKVGGASRKRKREVQMPSANIGLGWHSFDFTWEEKTAHITAVLQRIGHPTGDGPSFFTSMVLFAQGQDQMPLLKICQKAADNETKQKAILTCTFSEFWNHRVRALSIHFGPVDPRNRVSLWRFDTKYHFWSRISRRMARSLDSIVLEESVKRPLLDDLEWFLKDETRTFYAKHGIPYHRCYLLHGEPGTGKTSFMNSQTKTIHLCHSVDF
eukprot:g26145.t1